MAVPVRGGSPGGQLEFGSGLAVQVRVVGSLIAQVHTGSHRFTPVHTGFYCKNNTFILNTIVSIVKATLLF